MDLNHYYEMVEKALVQFELNPEDARGDEAGTWHLSYQDEYEIWVDVWLPEEALRPCFQIYCEVLELGQDASPAFYREVLETNHLLYGVCFALKANYLILHHLRDMEHLNPQEIFQTIVRVGGYAVDWGEILREKHLGEQDSGPISDV